jgi:hypothetical protein
MAIQPLDLQALFTQLETVGKTQTNQREGVQLQAAMQGAHIVKQTDERTHAVNELQDAEQGDTERIKDNNAQKKHQRGFYAQDGSQDSGLEDEPDDPAIIRDPDLGRNLDVSG